MSKEKLFSLIRYANDLKNKLTDAIPEKHKNRPQQYKQFLEKELKATNVQVEALRLAGADKK